MQCQGERHAADATAHDRHAHGGEKTRCLLGSFVH
jgi:hypothetical protein